MTKPLCRDCAYVTRGMLPRCAAVSYEERDLFDGSVIHYAPIIDVARMPGSVCGPDGILFEYRERTLWQRFLDAIR